MAGAKSVSDALYSDEPLVEILLRVTKQTFRQSLDGHHPMSSTRGCRRLEYELRAKTCKTDKYDDAPRSCSSIEDLTTSFHIVSSSSIMGSPSMTHDASPNNDSDKHSRKSDVSRYEVVDDDQKPYKTVAAGGLSLDDSHNDIFAEALARYPNDDCIDTREENKVRRKLDFRILPVLGVCYFFYYVDKTTLYVLPSCNYCSD